METRLKPKELGQLFLENYPVDENGVSQVALMDDLIQINASFRTTNGCDWARSNTSWLGKQYKIERIKQKGRIYSVQLVGFNTTAENHSIPAAVKSALEQRCVVLDISSTALEYDHKNGRYDTEVYTTDDFQVLSKAVNDAKRQHCKECKNNKCRYDARRLGYNKSFTKGDFDSDFCEGCYWFDPIAFNRDISK